MTSKEASDKVWYVFSEAKRRIEEIKQRKAKEAGISPSDKRGLRRVALSTTNQYLEILKELSEEVGISFEYILRVKGGW